MDISTIRENTSRAGAFAVGFTAALIVFIPVIVFTTLGSGWIEVFSVIASALLTLALVVLYYQQYRIIDKQTNLMRREYQSTISISPRVGADDREVVIRLKNTGRGNIKRLLLESEIVGETGGMSISPGKSIFTDEENGNQRLPANSEYRKFRAIPRLKHDTDSERDNLYRLKYFTGRLSQADVEQVTLRLKLQVVDEDISEGYSMSFELAEQELNLAESEIHEIEKDDGDTMEIQSLPGRTIEECIDDSGIDAGQDIISMSSPFFNEEEFRIQLSSDD